MTTDTKNFEIYDDRFAAMIPDDAQLVRHFTGMEWAEGPVYFSEGDYLLWSDIPNDRMLRYSDADGVSVFRQPAGYTNGHYRDREGRLVSCEHGNRRVSRTEHDGTIVTLADNYEGNRLNSPNDLVVKSDGTIWFTDPPYGILSNREGHKADSELAGCFVFRLEPDTGALEVVVDSMDRPNGIAFSPDESVLYVADTGEPRNIMVFDVEDGSRLANGREFAVVSPGASDGFRCDTRRQHLHQRSRRHPCVQPASRASRQDTRPRRPQRQLLLRRPRQEPPLHLRRQVPLLHRPERHRRPDAIKAPGILDTR